MKSLENRIAWLAGIVDGEGCISATTVRRWPGTGRKFMTQVAIFNTDELMIREIANICDSLGVRYNLNVITRPSRPNAKDGWRLSFVGMKRAEPILRAVLPYLVSKKERAELVLTMIQHRQSTMDVRSNRSPRPNPDDDAWLSEQILTMREFNRKGPPDG